MVEKGSATRRSRRAASLTAQFLWNYQIEDENNNKLVIKIPRKSLAVEEVHQEKHFTFSGRRGRKRSIANNNESQTDLAVSNLSEKKKKLLSGCSGDIFSVIKPLHVLKDHSVTKKLTASVAPRIKINPYPPKPTIAPSTSQPIGAVSSTHVNPILLLPVSLETNRTLNNEVDQAGVGRLSLVTLQATDFMNCFNLNKSVVDSKTPTKPWRYSVADTPAIPSIVHGYNNNNPCSYNSNSLQDSSEYNTYYQRDSYMETQEEPLNLKMGETTIPSFKNNIVKHASAQIPPVKPLPQYFSHVDTTPMSQEVKKKSANNLLKHNDKIPIASIMRVKPAKRKSSSGQSEVVPPIRLVNIGSKGKRLFVKCPSPEYACSSPDADDVHRKPHHSCNHKQIELRRKAAPIPGSHEFKQFIEMQRHLLAKAKKAKKAKRTVKSRSEAKKPKPKPIKADKLKRTTTVDPIPPLSPEETNHGWQWTGKPYTSYVFSVESGKHVRRKCYPGMSRKDKRIGTTDVVLVHDSVFLLASGEEELSYIGKVSALWEKPSNKEMMISLVWYYRPEHTEDTSKDFEILDDELFSSRHQDEISVACVEERCNVVTYSQFFRTHAKERQDRMWVKDDLRRVVPFSKSNSRPMMPNETPMNVQDMFFCRRYYDVLQKRIKSKLPPVTSIYTR